jgi:CheY-like chemotaxis protein
MSKCSKLVGQYNTKTHLYVTCLYQVDFNEGLDRWCRILSMSEKIQALVVDDENIAAGALQRLLRGRGFDCKIAANERQAFNIVRDGYFPEVALIDYLIPQGGRIDYEVDVASYGLTCGMRLSKEILRETSGICRIVLMTGLSNYQVPASESGVWGYCEKPIGNVPALLGMLELGMLAGDEIGAPTRDLNPLLKLE